MPTLRELCLRKKDAHFLYAEMVLKNYFSIPKGEITLRQVNEKVHAYSNYKDACEKENAWAEVDFPSDDKAIVKIKGTVGKRTIYLGSFIEFVYLTFKGYKIPIRFRFFDTSIGWVSFDSVRTVSHYKPPAKEAQDLIKLRHRVQGMKNDPFIKQCQEKIEELSAMEEKVPGFQSEELDEFRATVRSHFSKLAKYESELEYFESKAFGRAA